MAVHRVLAGDGYGATAAALEAWLPVAERPATATADWTYPAWCAARWRLAVVP